MYQYVDVLTTDSYSMYCACHKGIEVVLASLKVYIFHNIALMYHMDLSCPLHTVNSLWLYTLIKGCLESSESVKILSYVLVLSTADTVVLYVAKVG